MSQQPDKLFRDKLYHYEKPVSGGAWERISSAHSGGTSFGTVYKVAATLILLAVAGFLIFPPFPDQQPATLAVKADPSAATPPARTETATTDESTSLSPVEKQTAAIATTGETATRNVGKGVIQNKDVIPNRTDAPANAEFTERERAAIPVVPDSIIANSHHVAATEVKTNTTEVVEQATPQDTPARKTVTIVLNAEMVNEKYLRINEIPEATTTGKEASTLRKLLDIAYDLKHNQDPIGDLRQKKNEILAFNFKRGKGRNEN